MFINIEIKKKQEKIISINLKLSKKNKRKY